MKIRPSFRGDRTRGRVGGEDSVMETSTAAPAADAMIDDGELLRRYAAEQSQPAFAAVFARHAPLVWGVCRRRLPNEADREDAFQAVFTVLAQRAGDLTERRSVAPWLHRTAWNVTRKRRRWNWFRKTAPLPENLAGRTAADAGEVREELDAALRSLPPPQRAAVLLCHLEGCSRTEAAARLGCPEGTLSSWLDRGLKRLRRRLGERETYVAGAAGFVRPPEWLVAPSSVVAAPIPGVLSMMGKALSRSFAVAACLLAMAAAWAWMPSFRDAAKKPAPSSARAAETALAKRVYEALAAEIQIGRVDGEKLYCWSLRWAESEAKSLDDRPSVLAAHLQRMKDWEADQTARNGSLEHRFHGCDRNGDWRTGRGTRAAAACDRRTRRVSLTVERRRGLRLIGRPMQTGRMTK